MILLHYGYSPFLALLFRSIPGGLLAASLLLSGAVLNGQEYYFKHYEVANGLSHNTIHCATQDDRGFMWFGTKNGLNRFDGYQFDWYQSDEEVVGSIGSNFIECLDFVDGLLWVGTDNGLYTGNPRTGKFELVVGTADKPILDVAHDAFGNVWFIVEGVLCRIGVDGSSAREYQLPNQGPVRKIAVSPNGRISVATATAVFLYQPAHEAFLHLPIVPVTRNDFPLEFSSLYFLNESSLALGTVNHGAFLYDLPNGSASPILDKAENRLYVRDFLLRDNNLWIGTEEGVYIYNLSGGGTKHLTKDPVRPYALSDNAVYCIREDTHGGVWIGTYFRGLNYYSESLTGFQKFLPVTGQNSVSGSAIREIVKDRSGFLWIGTEDAGLNRYDPEQESFRHFPLKTAGEGIVARNVHGLLANGDELWAGTFQNGLFILDVDTGKIKRHLVAGKESGLKSNFIYTIGRAKDGRIYALTSSGVHLYDQASEQFRVVSFFPEDYFYTSFLEDSDGGLWVGTYWDGLFYHHPERNESRAYGRKATDGKQLSNDAINGIFEDSRKNIWVSTENGLNLIESGKTQVVRYGKKDGFPGNVFYSVLEDEKGKLWMSTTSGLVRFAPETGYIDQYTTENGLLANQFNYNSAYRAENGRMYFGGVKGFVSFAPYDVRFNQQTAPDGLALTGLKINGPGNAEPAGGRLPDYAGDSTASIELAHFQSTFSISYTALDYNTPGLTRYRYQLAGLDDGWVDAGNANTIYFTALPYGDYTLRLKAKTNNSDWGLPTELLDLRITPPWWKSQWAYVLYAVLSGLCLFLLLWSYHRYSREKQRQQLQLFDNEKQKDLYQAKIDFFTNVSHEILTPLTLIKMPIEKLLATAKDGSKVKTNLSVVLRNTTRLVNLVEQLLDFRKTEMDNATLSFVRVDLRELVEDTKERFQSAAEDKGLVV
jgi:ligand-binding sensor domain-containing protein